MAEIIIPNTDDVFVSYAWESGEESCYYIRENALVYVASGKLDILLDDIRVANFNKGECVFVRKDHRMTLVNYPAGTDERHLTVFLFFPRQLLFEYYKTLHEADMAVKVVRSRKSFLHIQSSSLVRSLFDSFKPFWEKGGRPEKHWLRIKVLEAIRLLLITDSSMYATLFDFTSKWRLDILDFMEKNYMYQLSVSDLAHYTGRSVATFKRDFSSLSEESPRNWIINRRLREAHHLLNVTDWPVFKIMQRVGFKNFSHFSRRFRSRYGIAPSEVRGSGDK